MICTPQDYHLLPLYFAMDLDPGAVTNLSYEISLLPNGCSPLAHFLPLEGQRPVASGDVGCSAITFALKQWPPPPPPKFLSLSIHGINEKISVQAYETQVKFIFEFIQNGDTDMEPVPHLHEL